MEEIKSEFQVRVVRIGAIEKHPNADTLGITNVEGNPVIVKLGAFIEGQLAVYVPVDALVPTSRPEFAFLKKEGKTQHRIKATKLRGIFSMGLLVPVPREQLAQINAGLGGDEFVGLNVQVALGIEKWIPVSERELEASGDSKASKPRKQPKGPKLPVYGLDPYRKYSDVLKDGEQVVITEKIHGCNARFAYVDGRLWVGSHKTMRGATEHRVIDWLNRLRLKALDLLGIEHRAHLHQRAGDVWWEIARAYDMKKRLAKKPGYVLYGEIYGERVQDLTYDSPVGRKFRAFDVYSLKEERFLDYGEFEDFCVEIGLSLSDDVVPMFYWGPLNDGIRTKYRKLADTGVSELNRKQIIEGVVIKPVAERLDRCGRVALKLVGEGYLLRGEK